MNVSGSTRTALLVALCVVSSGTLLAAASMQQSVPPFVPQAEVDDLMRLNKDLNKQIKGQLDRGPDWEELGHQARLMSEIGNVLQYHKSAEQTDWWQFAGQLRDRARTIAEAAKSQDKSAARSAHRQLVGSCTGCHDQYRL